MDPTYAFFYVIYFFSCAMAQQQFRLVPGPRVGRLEIMVNSNWGTVCADGFDANDAVVACRSLNIVGGTEYFVNQNLPAGSQFPVTNMQILKTAYGCLGAEATLANCESSTSTSTCTHAEDIGLRCLGVIETVTTTPKPDFATLPPVTCANNSATIRLVGGTSTSGRVEIKRGNDWGTICDDNWDQNDAKVVCRMLCNSHLNAQAVIRSIFPSAPTATPILLNNVGCAGTETSIDKCTHSGWNNVGTCTHLEDAGVICAPESAVSPELIVPNITCTKTHIIADIDLAKYPNAKANLIQLLNPGTTCPWTKVTANNRIRLSIPYTECNTVKRFNSTHIIYENTARYLRPTTTGDITRDPEYQGKLNCELPRSKTDTDPMKPVMPDPPAAAGETEFDVRMSVFDPRNNEELTAPIPTKLGDLAGLVLQLQSADKELKLVLSYCFATPTQVVNSGTKQHTLMDNKCTADNTVTVRPINSTAKSITFQMFMFLNGTQVDPNLFVHCTGLICGALETSAACDQTCGVTRRKRDVTSARSFQTTFKVDATKELFRNKRGVGRMMGVVQASTGAFQIHFDPKKDIVIHEGIVRAVEKREEVAVANTITQGDKPKPIVNGDKKVVKPESSAETHRVTMSLLVLLLTYVLIVR